MKTFEFTLWADSGEVVIRVHASKLETAQHMLCEAEKCPLSAVKYWRVVPTAKQIKRTKSLLRGL